MLETGPARDNLAVMTAATPLLSELQSMPSDRLETTVIYIGSLLEDRRAKRNAMIDATAGSLAGPVGEALEAAMADCEDSHETTE